MIARRRSTATPSNSRGRLPLAAEQTSVFAELFWRLRQPEACDEADQIDGKAHGGCDQCDLGGRIRAIAGDGECSGEPGERCSDEPAADIGGKAFSRAPKMQRVYTREIVAPEAELRDGEASRDEDRDIQPAEAGRGGDGEGQGHHDETGYLEKTDE